MNTVQETISPKSLTKNTLSGSIKLKLKSFSLMIIFIAITAGCVVVPIPIPHSGDEPFPEEKCSFIVPGNTDKKTVEEKLGIPSAYRAVDKIYIYVEKQNSWTWVGAYGVAGISGIGLFKIPTYKTHLLIIEFEENDIVSAVQKFCEDYNIVLKSGLIIMGDGHYTYHSSPPSDLVQGDREWRFSNSRLIIGANEAMSKKAKQLVVQNKSLIYFYKSTSDLIEVKLDDNLSGNPGEIGFLLWVVDPGEHTIRADDSSYDFSIHCLPGEIYYVEQKEIKLKQGNKYFLKQEQKAIAEKEILKRKLVIDRLTMFFYLRENNGY